MTYQTPTPATTTPNKPLYAATAALGVIMAVTLVALAAIFFVGGSSDAASATPPQAIVDTPATEANVPLDKSIPPVAQEADPATPAAPAETQTAPAAATQADAAPAQAAPAETQAAPAEATQADAASAQAAPAQAAPAPQDFRPTCGTSTHQVTVGETFVISGTHTPHTVSVKWAFDHGDGFVDHRNPSHAYYAHPGVYTVTGFAEANGGFVQRVHCGTVTVTAPAQHVEFHCSIDNTYIPVNGDTVFRATSNADDHTVVYTFDHGDGYREIANPSYATYYSAGTYHVSVTAFYDGVSTHIDCGTVTVFADAVPTCPTHSVIGMTEANANAAISAANCTPVTVIRDLEIFPITADYVTDRVQLTVVLGTVIAATIG